MRDLDQRAREADARNKIWQYKIRRVVLFFLVSGGVLTILDKCPSIMKRNQASSLIPPSRDSVGQEKSQPKVQSTSASHKNHHRKSETTPSSTAVETVGNKGSSDNEVSTSFDRAKPREPYPVQVTNADDIEFKLLNAEGSVRAQTIKITMLLTTNIATHYIWISDNSIIDPEGNEYKMKSFTNGASSADSHVALNTGVPIKLTYTYGGILPTVKYIKLFKFEYAHRMLDTPTPIDFRDVLIVWK